MKQHRIKTLTTCLILVLLTFSLTGCGLIGRTVSSLLFKNNSIVGDYTGKNIQYSPDLKGNISLELRGDGSYKEEVILLNPDNSVDDLSFDSIIEQEGSYFVKDDQLSLIPSSLTQNGEKKSALELRNKPEEYGTGYTFRTEGDKLILTNTLTGTQFELTKEQ